VLRARGDSICPCLRWRSDGPSQSLILSTTSFTIAVRGDRKVVTAVTFSGAGAVYRTIRDKRMGDPVAVRQRCVARSFGGRFRGKKILSFRVGKITDSRNNKVYGCGADGTAPFELAGQLPVAGYPFLVNSTNVTVKRFRRCKGSALGAPPPNLFNRSFLSRLLGVADSCE